ncbi:MAG: hypothetical protein L3J88_10315 [Gammaproteobacteria bacterium]|nr:hypothetical protein [Gammaproteobacteria bacterium]MCF6363711.1 hypothetical protein [Gammaproteobacteria bacterium]
MITNVKGLANQLTEETCSVNSKAWGKNRECIEQQSLLAIASYILMRLFIDKKSADLGITDGDTTQKLKYHAKVLSYIKDRIGIASRVYYSVLSKVTCQMWHFLKSCFANEELTSIL